MEQTFSYKDLGFDERLQRLITERKDETSANEFDAFYEIGEKQVKNQNIGDLAIEAAKLANSAVTAEKIANLAVGTAAIADGAIIEAKIGSLAVSTAKIQDAAINNAKINDLSANKVNAGSLTGIDVNSSSGNDKISLTTGNLLKFILGSVEKGRLYTDSNGDIYVQGTDDVIFRAGGANRVGVYGSRIQPEAHDSYDLGSSTRRFDNGYIKTVRTTQVKIGNWTFQLRSGSNDLELDYNGCVKTRWETDGDLKQQKDVKWGWGVELPTC